jgi:hypothetical protein
MHPRRKQRQHHDADEDEAGEQCDLGAPPRVVGEDVDRDQEEPGTNRDAARDAESVTDCRPAALTPAVREKVRGTA